MDILILLLMLLATALLQLVFHANAAVLLAGGMATLCGLALLYGQALGRYPVRLTWMMATGLLLGYGAGSFNTMLSYALSGFDAASALGLPSQYLSYGFFLVLAACAVLLAAGFFETPLFSYIECPAIDSRYERTLWISVAMIAFAYLHGDLGYEGVTISNQTDKVSVFGALAISLPHVGFIFSSLGAVRSEGYKRWRMILLALFHLGGIFPQSRRSLLYTIVSTGIVLSYMALKRVRLSLLRQVILAVSLVVALAFSAYLFMALRVEMDKIDAKASYDAKFAPIWVAGKGALENAIFERQEILARLRENVRDRTFIIRYISLLGQGGETPEPMWGSDFWFSVRLVIPDALYRLCGEDKTPLRNIGSEEGLINEHFGLPVYDEANSILTAGIADFGLPGVLIYPVLCCAAFGLLIKMTDPLVHPDCKLMIRALMLNICMQAESDIASYFMIMRNIYLIILLWSVLRSMPSFYLSKWTRDDALKKQLQPL
jgi:hypothetical protein